MADEPIEPLDYRSGVKVVDIGDIRVARGMTRRPYSSCRHNRLHYDQQERRIWCADCERDVDAFEAFTGIVQQYSLAVDNLEREHRQLQEAQAFQARSLATRALDGVWRRPGQVPACPCCGEGLLPEDFKHGVKTVLGRDYAEARRRKRKPD